MRFLFPLETLLRLREITEQREERLLGQIQNQIASSRQTLEDLNVQRHNLCAVHESALQHSTSAFEVLGFYQEMHHIDDLDAAGKQHLAKLTALRGQQMTIYQTAHRKRDLLSSIKDDRLESFRTEQARQEQNAMDDTFSSRKNVPRQTLPVK